VLPKYRKSLPALHLHFAPWQRSGVTSHENKLLCRTSRLYII